MTCRVCGNETKPGRTFCGLPCAITASRDHALGFSRPLRGHESAREQLYKQAHATVSPGHKRPHRAIQEEL